jgi:hypothetical protein
MRKAIIAALAASLFVLACTDAGKPTKTVKGGTQTAGSAAQKPQAGLATGSSASGQTVTVNDPAFMNNVWGNVKDISAANRNFAGTSTTAVAGVRARSSDQGGAEEIPRAELERSVAELRKILAAPDLSAVERSCYSYYLGACQIKLGQTRDGRSRLEDARKADPGGRYARLAAEELARL